MKECYKLCRAIQCSRIPSAEDFTVSSISMLVALCSCLFVGLLFFWFLAVDDMPNGYSLDLFHVAFHRRAGRKREVGQVTLT